MIKRKILKPLFVLFMILLIMTGCGEVEGSENTSAPVATSVEELAPVVIAADSCSAALDQMLKVVNQNCAAIKSNQACYGRGGADLTPVEGVDGFRFGKPGDIVALADIQSLKLSPMDLINNSWGVALIRLPANIADTGPGQSITFVLFGDVELTRVTSDGDGIHSFLLTTGSDEPECASVSPGGLLVQTPDGVDHVSFSINGVEISLGSTVFLSAPRDDNNLGTMMTVALIEGSARINSEGGSTTAIAGLQVDVPLDDEFMADGEPLAAEAYEEDDDVYSLPIDLLERDIEIAEPLDDEALEYFNENEALFDGLDVEDVDEVFEYLTDDEGDEELPDYLINELGYTDFSDEVEDYLEDDLGYDLEEYDDYDGDEPDDEGAEDDEAPEDEEEMGDEENAEDAEEDEEEADDGNS